jgi:hypothetical protein
MPLRIYTHNSTVFPPESYSEEDLNALKKLFSGSGYSKHSLEEEVLRIHIPAGKSLKDVLHRAQQPLDEGYRNFLKAQMQLRVRNANGENVTTNFLSIYFMKSTRRYFVLGREVPNSRRYNCFRQDSVEVGLAADSICSIEHLSLFPPSFYNMYDDLRSTVHGDPQVGICDQLKRIDTMSMSPSPSSTPHGEAQQFAFYELLPHLAILSLSASHPF